MWLGDSEGPRRGPPHAFRTRTQDLQVLLSEAKDPCSVLGLGTLHTSFALLRMTGWGDRLMTAWDWLGLRVHGTDRVIALGQQPDSAANNESAAYADCDRRIQDSALCAGTCTSGWFLPFLAAGLGLRIVLRGALIPRGLLTLRELCHACGVTHRKIAFAGGDVHDAIHISDFKFCEGRCCGQDR
jgi:hypothetical protein